MSAPLGNLYSRLPRGYLFYVIVRPTQPGQSVSADCLRSSKIVELADYPGNVLYTLPQTKERRPTAHPYFTNF